MLPSTEKYAPTDQSVTAQVLKVIAANPDAVYIFSAGTPGALPHVELVKRGYKGRIYFDAASGTCGSYTGSRGPAAASQGP